MSGPWSITRANFGQNSTSSLTCTKPLHPHETCSKLAQVGQGGDTTFSEASLHAAFLDLQHDASAYGSFSQSMQQLLPCHVNLFNLLVTFIVRQREPFNTSKKLPLFKG
eukprot:4765957-Amphidinium_carterae.2